MDSIVVVLSVLLMTTSISAQSAKTNQTENATSVSCTIVLANNITTSLLRHYFKSNTSSGTVYMVYFRLKYTNKDGSVNTFGIQMEDTFEPDLWVWAAGKGKNLLRLPIDYRILSLGLLTIQAANVEINFDSSTYECLESLPTSLAIHSIGKYITENVTANESSINIDTQGPIICRSVFAFEHNLYGKKGIGFDCCAPSGGSIYVCDQSYSDAYELVWYGPIVLMCFIYLIGIVHFYKLYKKSFQQVQVRRLAGFHKTVEEIKMDVFNRIVLNTERWARIQTPEALIALRERCGLLDIIGIGKKNHSNIVIFLRIIFTICLFLGYYGIWGIFLRVYYDQLGSTMKRLDDSQKVFLNVIGHIGWIFCRKDLGIYYYSIFEVIYTALVPFFVLYSIASIWYKKKVSMMQLDPNKPLQPTYRIFYRFCNTSCGIALQYVTVLLTVVHFVFLGGVFLSYLIYMVGLGIFANIDVVSPWLIPIALFIHFLSTVFDPAYVKYKSVKESLFSICFEEFRSLIIKQNKEIFLPRDLIENFYIPNSRSLLYACFLKLLWVLSLLLLLLLVVLTLQYPYNTKLTSIVPFLGVQVIFVLPYLTKIMYVNNQVSPLEETVMKKDLHNYVKQYIKDRPELKIDETQLNGKDSESGNSLQINSELQNRLGIDTDVLVSAATEVVKKMKI